MAVVTQRLVSGKEVHYVRIVHEDRMYNRRIGFDKQKAERVNAQLLGNKALLKTDAGSKLVRMRPWLTAKLNARTNRAASAERQQVTDHVMCMDWFMAKRVCDVEPADIKKVIEDIRATGKLSESSITNIHSCLSSCFQWAVFDRILETNPCRGLPKGIVIRGGKKKRVPYTRAEARAAMACQRVRREVRVFLFLLFYTGMREGEACGRKFKDWWANCGAPLGMLHVHDQYDGQPLKTDDGEDLHPRWVPVHPELEKVLLEWWETGFEEVFCRQPTPEDFIFPTSTNVGCHSRSSAYKVFRTALRFAQVQNRTLHSTRHTFTTVARAGSRREDMVERITHNSKGSTLDKYTHDELETLCDIIKGVDYSVDRLTTSTLLASGPPKRSKDVTVAAAQAARSDIVGNSTVIEHDGQSMTITQWEKVTSIPRKTIVSRINLGWTIERALTVPVDCRKTRIASRVAVGLQSNQEISVK